jgi:hypothetical protein
MRRAEKRAVSRVECGAHNSPVQPPSLLIIAAVGLLNRRVSGYFCYSVEAILRILRDDCEGLERCIHSPNDGWLGFGGMKLRTIGLTVALPL